MARWRSGTRERLQATALQRFAEHGYDETTVAEIAAAAEVTERTFYRHFADKREVLFAGQDDFTGMFTDPIAQAPGGHPPSPWSVARSTPRPRSSPTTVARGPGHGSRSSTPSPPWASGSSASSRP